MSFHTTARVLTHHRTSSAVEVIYASHGFVHSSHWTGYAIFLALFIIAVAHLLWAHMEVVA